jgi:ribosomal protein S18 acetylase RimI-like enzyme
MQADTIRVRMTQTAWHISKHIYDENYPYTHGKRKDEELNKKIISLAKKNKFYLKQIQSVLAGIVGRRGRGFQIHVAKQVWGKSYKVVGFIIYNLGEGIWGRKGTFGLGSVEYWLVDPKVQGKGIGKLLYLQAEKRLTKCTAQNLSVMFDKNDARLCALYTRLGYKLIKKYDGKEVYNKESDRHITWHKINTAVFHFSDSNGGDVRVYEEEDQ